MNNQQVQSPQGVSLKGFGLNIQAKHPEYNDLSPEETAAKVLQKYPQYKDMVDPTKKSSFLEDEHAAWKATAREGFGKQDAASPFIGAGHAADALVNIPVQHAISGVNDLLTKIPGGVGSTLSGLESDFGKGVQKIEGTKPVQEVLKSAQDFSQNNPRLSSAIGGAGSLANAGLTTTAIAQGISGLKNFFSPKAAAPAIEDTFASARAATSENASQYADALRNSGFENLADPKTMALAQNHTATMIEDIAQTLAENPTNKTALADLDLWKGVNNALQRTANLSRVAEVSETPGLLSRLGTQAGQKAKGLLSAPLRHPLITGYGAYRAFGGQPLVGQI